MIDELDRKLTGVSHLKWSYFGGQAILSSASMQYIDWTPQLTIDSPANFDANVLVGAIVSTRRLYPKCIALTANLLIGKSSVLVSPVSLDECLGAAAKLVYCQLTNNPPKTHWNKAAYMHYCEKIFQSYEGWITAMGSMMKDWANASVPMR